ncbi:16S rRNA (guanine(966)-N(2))-methyltransferase RsmD [Polyangium jinanense]|uniref:16S rRNA (Guanine(966)-N(2))-methyltransferase RsmD n=1 Tax=Polyangium jinanense TaxID=2829994 RepID=A0A9X3X2U1_9BACT|nr:16S rRNA (guanine(966)-N(2))-methyltransferase RsmD [Polyangium jinanense]MDC3952722.1 16S rRNA (guanine(966)-N(2))-methyltransferase RsmD [Polyangium jinanense]MDC3980341.1 16S rRNA (guanine(966)-N(2))-methyltransferase RsmD [Polyangium jinanense]
MRVIGGSLGGRRLVAPSGHATRPTSDRVREALFNVLGDVSGAAVLDLYAGTGALGIEAISRGASRVVFVENGRPALAALRQNLASLGIEGTSRVITQPVTRALASLSPFGPFELILLDPPYAALAEAARVLEAIAAETSNLAAPGARVVFEHASRDAPPKPGRLVLDETRIYGDTAISLYTRAEDVPSEAADG